ncbi:hypothetical protein ACXZ1M_24370 [Duganella sp. PWIR1]
MRAKQNQNRSDEASKDQVDVTLIRHLQANREAAKAFKTAMQSKTRTVAVALSFLSNNETQAEHNPIIERALCTIEVDETSSSEAEQIAEKSSALYALIQEVDRKAPALIAKKEPITGRTLGRYIWSLRSDNELAKMVAEVWCNMNDVPFKKRKTPIKKPS